MSIVPSSRKRRWFQFSLRSLLILVTIFCIVGGWLGNEYRIVRERNALVHRIFTNGQRWGIVIDTETSRPSGSKTQARLGIGFVPAEATASLAWNGLENHSSTLRQWLGDLDQRVRVICIPADADPGDAAAAAELFPEARIWRTCEAESALFLSGRGRGIITSGLSPLTPADRDHLARYYNTLAANRENPRANSLPDRK